MKVFPVLIAFGFVSTGTVINFDSAAVGKTPPGWTITMTNPGGPLPQWEVVKDQSAPTQPYVLAQTSSHSSGGYPLAIYDRLSLRNADVSVRLKPVSGRGERAGGVVWRYRDPNNYYLVRANAATQDVAVYKVENGRRTQISSGVRHDIPSNAWSILKVAVRGDRFLVYVNHRRVLVSQDRTFAGPGKVGLWTVSDSVTYFDDFRVYPK